MPAPATIDDFLEIVHKSAVIDPLRLKEEIARHRAANDLPSDPKRLARLLVREGILTNFQADQFLRGRWRGFTIGDYLILEGLGAGGMGVVYLAEHQTTGERVAIKVLSLALAKDPWFRTRFYHEAQAITSLNHPNIVQAYEMNHQGNLYYLIMEYVDGLSLQDIVDKHGPMDILRACHYLRQGAAALRHLQEVGMVHRDIKPGNLLLDRQGVIKLLDLGLAHFVQDRESANHNAQSPLVGTRDYLAPEQIVNSDDVDFRADIYSLGATFYYLLTGQAPFEAEEHDYHKLLRHLAQNPTPIGELRPETPPELVAVVEKMMAKNPWDRFQGGAAVVDALTVWTQQPIEPPLAAEMPWLCPALRRPEGEERGAAFPPYMFPAAPGPQPSALANLAVSLPNTPAPIPEPKAPWNLAQEEVLDEMAKTAPPDPLEELRAAMAVVDAYYKERGLFQGRFGFGKSPALIVIDMAYGWTDPAYAGGSERLESAVQALLQLLPVARAKSIPIFYTTALFQEEPPIESAAPSSKFSPWDQRASEIEERLHPEPADHLIIKEHASAFMGTPLLGHLVGRRVDTLLITGCSTSACVRATATDARGYHLRPIIVREAVQDRSEIAHEWTLFDLQARFADVVSLAETIAYLQTLQEQ